MKANFDFKVDKTFDFLANNLNIYEITVGFFESARYHDGEQVAAVAKQNNEGARFIPKRPFFDNSNAEFEKKMPDLMKKVFPAEFGGILDKQGLNLVAVFWQDLIKTEIIRLKSPPNSPKTIKLKKSSNPLIDTGLMLRSVSFLIDKK